MNAPDLTPGPDVRDAVLRRARVLRLRRQAAWSVAGGALAAVAFVAGGVVLQPSAARRTDVLLPGPATPSSSSAPAVTYSPTASPSDSPSPSPVATTTPPPAPHVPATTPPPPTTRPPTPTVSPTPSPTWLPDDSEPPPEWADEYLDDHGVRRAYPAAYGVCEYNRDEDAGANLPGITVTASGVRVEGTTVFFTVTVTNTGTTARQVREETMVPMDALFQGTRQMTGTGTFRDSVMLTHMLEPGDSVSAVHRMHAVTCAHSRGPRAPLPAGEYRLEASALLYPDDGSGGPVYAPPVTVTIP
jgi:hypothetical protein